MTNDDLSSVFGPEPTAAPTPGPAAPAPRRPLLARGDGLVPAADPARISAPAAPAGASGSWEDVFTAADRGAQRMMQILIDPRVSQINCHSHDRISYVDPGGTKRVDRVFGNQQTYAAWLNQLLAFTDAGYTDVMTANTSSIEGSFRPDRIEVHGSIIISTAEVTGGDPILIVRKQPLELVTLDRMLDQHMMSVEMRLFLEQAVRGRANILISGGSGAGKTTLARALSYFIDPLQHIITVEEIDELHLRDRLQNVSRLTTVKKKDSEGRVIRQTTLDDLVRDALRMRGDRVWVGETRGKEAYALVKACNSGHDGSVTTIHADDPRSALLAASAYIQEAGIPEETANSQLSRAFNLVVQINKVKMGKRAITHISEVEAVREAGQFRMVPLYSYDWATEGFRREGTPTNRLLTLFAKYGVNYHEIAGR